MQPPPPSEQSRKAALVSDERLGSYRLIRTLSKGAVGTLYTAKGPSGLVLLRVLTPELSEEARGRVEQALDQFRQVECPYVTALVERGVEGGRAFYALDDPGSSTLLDVVRRGRPLDEAELVWVGQGLATALAALHDVGVPHGNVLPTTVAVTPTGPVLVDLGWGPRLEGTTPRVEDDLYALGGALAFASSGLRPPPPGRTIDLGKRTPWLSKEVADVIQRLLGAVERRPSARDVAEMLGIRAVELGQDDPCVPRSLEPLLERLPDRKRTREGASSGSGSGSTGSSSRFPRTKKLVLKVGSLAELRPGFSLQCERVLGEGGMGVVYLMRDPRLGRHSALKVAKGGNATRLRRFKREIAVTARLSHPGIPPVYEADTTGDRQDYLLMRYVEGSSLKEILDRQFGGVGKRRDQDVRNLIEALVKVGEAVAYGHSKGIVHRDLKPANIMVGGFGEVFVMDWGLARDQNESVQEDEQVRNEFATVLEATRNLTHDGAFLGTPGYMAPEQARGDDVDGRADVFALGSVLAEILTGAPPFAAQDTLEILAHTSEGVVELPIERDKTVPPELNAIVAKALAVDRGYRYTSIEQMVADLKSYLEGREVSVYRYGPSEQAFRLLRRHFLLFSGLSVIVFLLLFTGIFVTFAFGEREAALRESTQNREQTEAEKIAAAEQRRAALEERLRAAQELLDRGEPELARDSFIQALALEPSNPAAKMGVSTSERLLNQQATRQREEQETAQRRSEAFRLVEEAEAELQNKRTPAARRLFLQALAFEGSNEKAQQGLVRTDRLEQQIRQRHADRKRRQRFEALVEAAKADWARGRQEYQQGTSPQSVEQAYLAALTGFDEALRISPDPEVRQTKIRAAQELYLILREEGQPDLAAFLLQMSQAPAPADGALEVPRDPNVVVVEADRVRIRRAFGGVVFFAPTRVFDPLREELRQHGERFLVEVEVLSELTATHPPKINVRGLRATLLDREAQTRLKVSELTFEGGPYPRNVRLIDDRRRVVAPFDAAHTLRAAPYTQELLEAVKTRVAEILER